MGKSEVSIAFEIPLAKLELVATCFRGEGAGAERGRSAFGHSLAESVRVNLEEATRA
jgi:hypothetical protein